jgi:ribokinase
LAAGEYTSIIVPGASARLTRSDVVAALTAIADPVALVLQLELPLEIVTYAAEIAAGRGMLIVLNASPIPDDLTSTPHRLWNATDLLVVNRAEAMRLLGAESSSQHPAELARSLADTYGIASVSITLGSNGAVLCRKGRIFDQPAYPAEVVDTIGARDAFLGALVAGIVEGKPTKFSLRRAAAAGALAVEGRGALESIPNGAQIDELIRRHSGSPARNRS